MLLLVDTNNMYEAVRFLLGLSKLCVKLLYGILKLCYFCVYWTSMSIANEAGDRQTYSNSLPMREGT